jgi:hypothetical protein
MSSVPSRIRASLSATSRVYGFGQPLTRHSTSIDAAVPRIDNDHSGMGD